LVISEVVVIDQIHRTLFDLTGQLDKAVYTELVNVFPLLGQIQGLITKSTKTAYMTR
jgi:hypothetical protein